jgi:TonB family protein
MRTLLRVFVLSVSLCAISANTLGSDADKFDKLLREAALKSTLTSRGSSPFHLRLSAQETRRMDPQMNLEVDVWWAAPDRWRREIKSLSFSQTAVQNGQHYYESNSSDYMPFWIYELIQEALDPVPVEALKNQNVEFTHGRCAEWQLPFSADGEQIEQHSSVCFNSDGTIAELFTRPASAEFAAYRHFDGKQIASSITVWPGGATEVKAMVTDLTKINDEESLFAVPKDMGVDSRLHFMSIPGNALDSYKLHAPPVDWPVLHNFPASGAFTVAVRIDRNGNVRELGAPLSRNVVVNDAAVAQIKTWKFKPYPNEEHPVQVDTNITLRFASRVQLLGGDGKAYTNQNFFQRIAKARELSDPRTPASKPFHMHASFATAGDASGTYDELWASPEKWSIRVELGNLAVAKTRSGDKLFTKISGSAFVPKQIDEFLDSLDMPFPRTDGSFIEGDWGHSAVRYKDLDLVRVARGRVNEQNQPIDGQAYWFDSDGRLRAAFWDPRMTAYSDFVDWNGKQIPRRIEVSANGSRLLLTSIQEFEPLERVDDSLFVLAVAPDKIPLPDDYKGPVVVQPQPIYKPKPKLTLSADDAKSAHGVVVVAVQLDPHGHVVSADVTQSASKPLDDAAVQAALQWEFTPMLIRGQPVPGSAKLTFTF